MLDRGGWVLAGIFALALVTSLAGVVQGGSLDPVGPPAPTMKSLDDIPPSWHRNLSAAGDDTCNTERFECVLADAAVLDHETGLVWERVPSTGGDVSWFQAFNACVERVTGNEPGWRLPTAPELATLIDVSQSSPSLPSGHPFDLGAHTASAYWTATTPATDSTRAFFVDFSNGNAGSAFTKTLQVGRHWCVRASGAMQ